MTDAERALALLRKMVGPLPIGATTQASISTDLYGGSPILETRTHITLDELQFVVDLMTTTIKD